MSHVPANFVEESPEVYYLRAGIPSVGPDDIAFLKRKSSGNPRLRCRVCLHASPESLQHEMLIVHHRDAFVRPHRHLTRSESLIVTEGEAIAVIFDDDGNITSTMSLTPPGGEGQFSYYMQAGVWHSLVVLTTWFVFVEAAAGPFDATLTSFPPWAPDGRDAAAAQSFADELRLRVAPS